MAPSVNPKFSAVFASLWPNDGTEDDSDFSDDHQPDVSTDGESILSGDNQVIAEGRAHRAHTADSDEEDGVSDKEDAPSNDGATIDQEKNSSGEQRYNARSLYATIIPKLSPAQGRRRHL